MDSLLTEDVEYKKDNRNRKTDGCNEKFTVKQCLVRYMLCCVVALTGSASPCLFAQEDEARLKQLKRELAELNSRLQNYQGERNSLESDLREQELELSRIHREIYDTDQSITAGESRLTILKREASELTVLRTEQSESLKNDLTSMYQSGTEEPLKMVLNQESPADFSRMLNYYRYLLEARADRIQSYLSTIQTLASTQEDILTQRDQLSVLRVELAAEEKNLARAQTRKIALLKKVTSRILTAEQQIVEREKDRRKLESLIDEVEQRIKGLAPPQSYRPFSSIKGQFKWPVTGSIARRYGSSRGGNLRWQGVVLRSNTGTAVESVHYGRVVFADYLRGYGLLVIVDHGQDYLTLYGHNQSLFVEPGDWVSAGDQIALAGSISGISETGVYFEIRHQGRPQNPTNWMAK